MTGDDFEQVIWEKVIEMKDLTKIKLTHTVIWLIMASAVFYTLYSGLYNRITICTWIAIGLIVCESAVLLTYKWKCPLTGMARKYTDSTKDNFDIYLPNWLAKNNKLIFTIIFLAGLFMVMIRVFWN